MLKAEDGLSAKLVKQGISPAVASTFTTVVSQTVTPAVLQQLVDAGVIDTSSGGLSLSGPAKTPTATPTGGGQGAAPTTPGAQIEPAGSPTDFTQAPSTGPGSGPGGASTDPMANTAPIDWKMYLADWGFTPDMVNEIDRIFKTNPDAQAASMAALAYIRGTPWYATTFAGIGAGIKNGIVQDESGYRDYTNQLTQLYRRFYGRDVTTNEVAQALTNGQRVPEIGAHFQGQAYIAANRGDIQYTLGAFDQQGQATEDQLNALGDNNAGLSNMIGPQLQARLDKARQRLSSIMQGTVASPSLSVLNGGRIVTPGGSGTNPDIPA